MITANAQALIDLAASGRLTKDQMFEVLMSAANKIKERQTRIIADRAAAYHFFKKALRKSKLLTQELDENLDAQWWEDVQHLFGTLRSDAWWL